MGFEHKYPYSDFHELNLDWILGVVKRLETEWPEFKTTLETEWNEYKDGLTGEGGEWPTFKTQIETTVNNFIHDVVGPYNENLDYQSGMFCYYEGKVYKCLQTSSAAFPRPFNSYNWYSYENQNTNSIVNDLFNYLTDALNDQDNEIYNWIQRTAAQWDETIAYKVGDYCSAYVGGSFIPSTWRYYKCIQDCTGVNVLDTNYWKEVVFASDVAETIAAYKQAMQDQYDQFLTAYQRQFGVVQIRGSSTTDVMSQKAVSDELEAIDNTFDDIESGQEVVGHAAVADNLTPYSEDSGAIQDAPFISQGTGTNNNTDIVTTGDKAKQLEKLGNGIVAIQLIRNTAQTQTKNGVTMTNNGDGTFTLNGTASANTSFSLGSGEVAVGSKIIYGFYGLSSSITGLRLQDAWNMGYVTTFEVRTVATYPSYDFRIDIIADTVLNNIKVKPVAFNITSWDLSIITDLTTNPYHFSWYYNGSLDYNVGSIEHGNGVKLVCTKGRNLFNSATVVTGKYIGSDGVEYSNSNFNHSDYIVAVPNTVIYAKNIATASYIKMILCYDKNKTYIGPGVVVDVNYHLYTTLPNTSFVILNINNADLDGQTLTPYYTSEQGGEGYDQSYDYEAPDIIDTGSEQLGAFDKKTPDGVITRGGTTFDFSTINLVKWSDTVYVTGSGYDGNWKTTIPESVATLSLSDSATGYPNRIVFTFTTAKATIEEARTALLPYELEAELLPENRTTEQGTSFRQYVDINDYGIMYWLDENDELVSIPQGLKIQYPVNYKGFIDDAYMYTNGDATALAKNESITDGALNARGYYKQQDVSSDITDVAGLTYQVKKGYKVGNIVTIMIVGVNSTGTDIPANTVLFNLGSNRPYEHIRFSGTIGTSVVEYLALSNNGDVYCISAIPNGNAINIALSYISQ